MHYVLCHFCIAAARRAAPYNWCPPAKEASSVNLRSEFLEDVEEQSEGHA